MELVEQEQNLFIDRIKIYIVKKYILDIKDYIIKIVFEIIFEAFFYYKDFILVFGN